MVPHRTLLLGTVVAWLALGRPAAAARCDQAGADRDALLTVRDAMDAACSCVGATSPAAWRACAGSVVGTAAADGTLPPACRGVARDRGTHAVCGIPGARVCCRHDAQGRLRGRIVRDPDLCRAPAGGAACLADEPTIADGCTATGCVVCGDGVVQGHEACDPPGQGRCTAGCRLSVCGNGVVEPGEVCEAGDPAACTVRCDGACPPPPPGETTVACVTPIAAAGLAIAAGGGGALAAWRDRTAEFHDEVRARRLDALGAPVDATAFTVSRGLDGNPDPGFTHYGPAATGDASGWYVGWTAVGTTAPIGSVRGVRVRPDGTVADVHEVEQLFSVGTCGSALGAPVSVALRAPDDVALLWPLRNRCAADEHVAGRVHFPGGVPTVAWQGTLDPFQLPPVLAGAGDGVVAAGDGTAVAVMPYLLADWSSGSPVVADAALGAWWIGDTGLAPRVRLTSAAWQTPPAPGAAFGAGAVLVAWAQLAAPGDTTETQIRILRFTHAAGALDPDGGVTIAAGAPVASSPVVAFAGGRWLVAWLARTTPATGALRAVAVDTDGGVLDAAPRTLAANVALLAPRATGVGDRVFVAFARTHGAAAQAVNVVAVTP